LLNTPFPDWPSFSDEEADAVSRVLKSNRVNYWTGDEGKAFEREFAAWVGMRHGVALANGTLALDICWPALGIGPGDEVITSPRTYFASAASIAMTGARPVFADVDRDSGNITPQSVEPLINAKTKAILCVHVGGWPCDLEGLRDLADTRAIKLVEDCAQAHGAAIHGRSVGTYGDISAWSFCQDKIITTGGEGGMVTLDDEATWKKVWAYKDHGKSWDEVHRKDHPPGFRWLHEGWGSNWRLTEMQAAIGRIQLGRVTDWHDTRKKHGEALASGLGDVDGLRAPTTTNGFEHAWYRFYAYVRPEALKSGWSRDRIMVAVEDAGVPCRVGSCSEVYREKAFEDAGLAPPQRLPNALELGDTSLAFLVHPTLTDREIGKTIDVVRRVMAEATR
jgi:dTDP-4-amino-4,6-dideoxygalactose transaminase